MKFDVKADWYAVELNDYANRYNAMYGDSTLYSCPKCRSKGYIMEVVFDQLEDAWVRVVRHCDCYGIRKKLEEQERERNRK